MSIKPCCLDQGYIQAFHNHSTYYSHLINRKKRERERRKQGYSCGNLTQHKEQDLISIFFSFRSDGKVLKKAIVPLLNPKANRSFHKESLQTGICCLLTLNMHQI